MIALFRLTSHLPIYARSGISSRLCEHYRSPTIPYPNSGATISSMHPMELTFHHIIILCASHVTSLLQGMALPYSPSPNIQTPFQRQRLAKTFFEHLTQAVTPDDQHFEFASPNYGEREALVQLGTREQSRQVKNLILILTQGI